ncbi:MAG: DNA translocase FtsK 4TM domain-containing protein, partial [Proteiniphilum sp.]|nr:DNA translocase FtsK 4TM domain-containing protein [Proteiniphilum sp.]
MAGRKKRRQKPKQGQRQKNRITPFLKNERVHFIFGVIVAFAGIFVLLSVISFFFTGAADQSKVINKTYLEVVRSGAPEIDNWTGAGGAYIAERIVNEGFGLFSVLIPFFLIYIGLRIMRVSSIPFPKALFITAFGLIGGSVSSAFILDGIFPHGHVKWGGEHGLQIERILESSVGWPGIVLLILLFITIIVVTIRKSSIYKIQKTLINGASSLAPQNNPPLDEDEDDWDEPEKEKKPGLIKRFFLWMKKTRRSGKKEYEEEDSEFDEPEAAATNTARNGSKPAATSPNPFTTKQRLPVEDEFEVIVPKDDEAAHAPHREEDKKEEETIPAELLPEEDYDPRKDLSSFRF